MRERRTPRLGPAEADRLLAGDPGDPDHRGLAALLDAATAPGSARELAGERAAVAGFVAAYRGTEPTRAPEGRRRARISSPARVAAVKVAAGVAVLVGGGTALAAETGNLPAGAQHHAHRLFSAVGVPAPIAPPRIPSPPPAPARPTTAAPSRSAPSAAASVPPDVPGLCRAWEAQREPRGAAIDPALVAAAGGEERVADFCAAELGASTPPGPAGVSPGPQPDRPGRPDEPGKPDHSGGPGEPGPPEHTGKPATPPGQGRNRPPGPPQ